MKTKRLILRKSYYEGCYLDVNEKLWTIQNNDITLKEALDCWWNSIRIDGNIVYKNAYTCDNEYELGNLKRSDLRKKIYITHWDYDADNYPICFAKFI